MRRGWTYPSLVSEFKNPLVMFHSMGIETWTQSVSGGKVPIEEVTDPIDETSFPYCTPPPARQRR